MMLHDSVLVLRMPYWTVQLTPSLKAARVTLTLKP